MRAVVVHSSLNSAGGGERVALAIIESLKEMGFAVDLVTVEPTDWEHLKRIAGFHVKPDRERPLLPFRIGAFGIYMRIATALKLLSSKKYDLVVNTHGDMIPVKADITYMHYPTFAVVTDKLENIKYTRSTFWRVYFEPYRLLQKLFLKYMRNRSPVILTNSEYSKDAIRRHINRDAIILYPPVDVKDFISVSNSKDREDMVIACGRFTPEKRFEVVLEVARHLQDISFKIVGAHSGKVTKAYLRKLTRITEEQKLKNVELLVNYPKKKQIRLYSRAKVFLHPMRGEHFGIAVVEAMAAGLVPVVHKSGGPWYDIVMQGRYGLGFCDLEEAVAAVEKAIANFHILCRKGIDRARKFSKQFFIRQFKRIVERVLKMKSRG